MDNTKEKRVGVWEEEDDEENVDGRRDAGEWAALRGEGEDRQASTFVGAAPASAKSEVSK